MSDFLAEPEARCSGPNCGRPIRWVRWREKVHPIDSDPVQGGTLMVSVPEQVRDGVKVRAVVVYLTKREVELHEGPLYASHYSTCPNADYFRRGRGIRR